MNLEDHKALSILFRLADASRVVGENESGATIIEVPAEVWEAVALIGAIDEDREIDVDFEEPVGVGPDHDRFDPLMRELRGVRQPRTLKQICDAYGVIYAD